MAVIGFDLDMTLIDSRPGVAATYRALSDRLGVFIDVEAIVHRLGPPLEHELANWLPEDQIDEAADLYRSLYPQHAVAAIPAMPGAHELIARARELGHQTLLVTGKHAGNARLHVEHLGLDLDDVVGHAWRFAKADVMRERGVSVYVGDHEHDMDACTQADVTGIGVTTGPSSADDLRAAGATHVVADLHEAIDLL